MSLRIGLCVLVVGELPLEQPGHDFDARERILDLVGDRRRHLAQRGQAVAQSLALFQLFDAGQVLEEKRRAGHLALRVAHLRKRVADHLSGPLETQLGTIGEVGLLEAAGNDPRNVGDFPQDLRVVADRCHRRCGCSPKIR